MKVRHQNQVITTARFIHVESRAYIRRTKIKNNEFCINVAGMNGSGMSGESESENSSETENKGMKS